jgi:phospholipid/cholesterol/gamma-HCH transport system ATP-binding protein
VSDPEIAIELRDVHKAFRGNRVLRGVSLRIPAGATFTILGGSGSGKSVCLKHMIGLLKPDAGRVLVLGRDITDMSERQLVDVRKDVSMIFQSAALFDSLSVYENVAYPLREHRRWPEERIAERVRECLDAVGLRGGESLMPAELSGGMRKRVGVARGIALEPRIILYDEPTTGLDPITADLINRLIRRLQERLGITSIAVTHDMRSAYHIADRIAMLHEGRIHAMGTPAEIQATRDPIVRQFIEGSSEGPLAPT